MRDTRPTALHPRPAFRQPTVRAAGLRRHSIECPTMRAILAARARENTTSSDANMWAPLRVRLDGDVTVKAAATVAGEMDPARWSQFVDASK